MTAVYVDGIRMSINDGNHAEWRRATTVNINYHSQRIAIHGKDMHGVASGLMASLSTGRVTDSSWKCVGDLRGGWQSPAYVDSGWPDAVIKGRHNQGPWTHIVNGISLSASWIWGNVFGHAYCRGKTDQRNI